MTTDTLEASPLTLKRPDLIRTGAYIGGRWVDGPYGRRFPVTDPADGSLVAEVCDGDADLAQTAADAAAEAFKSWKTATVKTRSGVVRAWFELVLKHQDDLARLICREMGKPFAEAKGEVAYGAAYLEWFAEEVKRSNGEVIPPPVAGRAMLALREPVGVVAAITPWNFPTAMICRKLGPAIAAGCTVVAKPAEDTPLSALALAVLADEAGVPAGVLNIVPCSRAHAGEVADAWLSDDRVRKVSFTGSTAVGKQLAAGSAATLKRLSLELGGDAPFIVLDDADLDVAAEALMKAKFRNAGQACVAANRVLVQSSVYDAFAEKVAAAVQKLTVGGAAKGAFDIGPLINERGLEKVERLVRQMVAGGAKVLVGGERHALGGTFYQPTVLSNVPADLRGSCEEIFGPVIALAKVESEDEAVRLANATAFGLSAYLCSRDLARVWRVASRLETGMVGVNEGIISSEAAPFGGVKQSGYGREGSTHGLDEYLNIKYVCLGGLN